MRSQDFHGKCFSFFQTKISAGFSLMVGRLHILMRVLPVKGRNMKKTLLVSHYHLMMPAMSQEPL